MKKRAMRQSLMVLLRKEQKELLQPPKRSELVLEWLEKVSIRLEKKKGVRRTE
jgi:hypothetical protein